MLKTAKLTAAFCASIAAVSLSQPILAQEQDAASADRAADEANMNAAAKVLQAALDAYRAGDFEKAIAAYHSNAVIELSGYYRLTGKAEIRKVYKAMFDNGVPAPEILESGWTGEAVYLIQNEYLPDGTFVGTTYAEFTVVDGKIVSVIGRLAG